jgi:23S rRNA pseudouridine955/2504/2580 synthase
MTEYIVTEDENGSRADKIVANLGKGVSYAFLQKIFRTNRVKINGKKANASDRVHSGDLIKIYTDISPPADAVNAQNPVYTRKLIAQFSEMIIFENDDFLAINKPVSLAVQPGTKVCMCVETFIKAYQEYKNCQCKLVHRLDKDTSGVLLIAKNQSTARQLAESFKKNQMKKTYLAVVDGKITESGCIDNFIKKTLVGNEEKMRISEDGQRAITKYRPLKMHDPEGNFSYYTLLELTPSTGRKHQLRAHCADYLKAPILGDKKYNRHPIHDKLFLHAHKISTNGLEIVAKVPSYFPVAPASDQKNDGE